MPTIDNFSVWIEVEGERLPEHGVQPSANGDQVIRTCWIPSEAGKEFKIAYQDTLRKIDTCTRIFVDGVSCTGRVTTRILGPAPPLICIHEGEYPSATTYKPYIFSNCQLTEDEGAIGRAVVSLGEIVVDVDEVMYHGVLPWARTTTVALPPLKIHERAKKGIVHGTQLGKEVPTITQSKASVTPIRKLASFRFKYRPLDVLKADGIIPQDKPTPAKRQADPEDIIDLTIEDDCQDCQCGARSRKKAKVTKTVVKTEVKKEKLMTFGDGEVLDLTIWYAHHSLHIGDDRVFTFLKICFFFYFLPNPEVIRYCMTCTNHFLPIPYLV